MATVTWTGGSNDGNWSTGGNWSGASAPTTSDDVVINSTSQNISIVPGTAPSVGNSFTSLTITAGFTGSIGGGSTGSLNVNATTVTVSMGGQFIYMSAAAVGITTLNLDSTGAGTFYLTGGTVTTLYAGPSGQLQVGGSATVTTLFGCGMTMLVAAGTSTTISSAGILASSRNVTTLNVHPGGVAVLKDSSTAGTINTYGNGRVNYLSSGTITTLNLFPNSRFDVAGGQKSFTITNTNRYAGAVLDKTAQGVTITFTNPETVLGARS